MKRWLLVVYYRTPTGPGRVERVVSDPVNLADVAEYETIISAVITPIEPAQQTGGSQ